ncbi:hypothetical protein CVT24_005287 [Panaeolus cyanescens]|uniref:Uncharacterized protein n=1 Tax=Panaeolus cyanescens TaxID=181874 RepID=A0A409Y8U5_9AGAR|nr:hypothetical protein CVT24_005287 [Panaeolus cyanescens]
MANVHHMDPINQVANTERNTDTRNDVITDDLQDIQDNLLPVEAPDMDNSLILPHHTVINPDTSFSLELEPAQSSIDASIWAAATQHEELTRQYRRTVYQIMQSLRNSVTGDLSSGLETQGAALTDRFEREKTQIQQDHERRITEISSRFEQERERYQQQLARMETTVNECNNSRAMWKLVCVFLLILSHYSWIYVLHK